ncbi:MAG: hypothetical protein LBR65_03730 [Culturomica sp.]|nr:hypothetical protein [Culturomica sp.]
MTEYLRSERYMGEEYPWNSLARDDKDYNHATGDCYPIDAWLPMTYADTKALEKYGHYELARKVLDQQLRTCHAVEPHTIWECYKPSSLRPNADAVQGLISADGQR